ncbi:MAG TPA: DNA repair protein RadC [Vicinamibacterales bacterium]|nr:DNA repair protein RadC [Vicinamibacterales bacterium]
MKGIAPHDRPRERLDRVGTAALSDHELLAIVLGHGHGSRSSLDVASAVLESAGGLHGLARVTADELQRVAGIGRARAAQIVAAVELGRRTLAREPLERTQVGCPRDVAEFLMPQFGSCAVEQFGVVLLDSKHRVLKTRLLSVGSLDASVVHPREVFRAAVLGGAAAVVLFHNHPSGDPTPSREDCDLTRRLAVAGELMGVDVLDHVILADTRYVSLREWERLKRTNT